VPQTLLLSSGLRSDKRTDGEHRQEDSGFISFLLFLRHPERCLSHPAGTFYRRISKPSCKYATAVPVSDFLIGAVMFFMLASSLARSYILFCSYYSTLGKCYPKAAIKLIKKPLNKQTHSKLTS
jgi:hypothetical protein